MPQLYLGEKIQVDLFGLSPQNFGSDLVEGTVVDLAPGVVTVKLERDDQEVTVGPRRIQSGRLSE